MVLIGAFLRFFTTSQLWLDEALTVNISHLPLSGIEAALRRDGSPPLYYVMLHYWMDLFGTGNEAVRTLAGIFGLGTLWLSWLLAKRLFGRRAGLITLVLLAVSPFEVFYSTEARMYTLVTFEVAALGLLLLNAMRPRRAEGSRATRPSFWVLAGIALSTCALLYTHYWALYILAATGAWLLWRAIKGPSALRARWSAGAMLLGSLGFIPWLPIFIFQAQHTGTPWALPVSPVLIGHDVGMILGGTSLAGRISDGVLGLFFLAAVLGGWLARRNDVVINTSLAGSQSLLATSCQDEEPCLHPALTMAALDVFALLLASLGALVSSSAVASRYCSILVVPTFVLCGAGAAALPSLSRALASRLSRVHGPLVHRTIPKKTLSQATAALVVVASVAGLGASVPNTWTNRTEAGRVAHVILTQGHPGDVVAYCPDQLGPATARLLPKGEFRQLTFPRRISPYFVDWVNYAKVNESAKFLPFVQYLERLAGRHSIWLVWAPGYLTYGLKCQQIAFTLMSLHDYKGSEPVPLEPRRYMEPMELMHYVPR